MITTFTQFVIIGSKTEISSSVAEVFIVLALFIQCCVILANVALMSLALFKYMRVLSRIKAQGSINRTFVIMQILTIVVFLVTWTAEGCFFLQNFRRPDEYQPVKNWVIADTVSLVADMINFFIIGFVIYKSSLV